MKKILVIEDDPGIVELLQFNLEQESYLVSSVGDGPAGMAALRESPPDLLILDLMLPGMSGIEICRQVRSDPDLAPLPLIMLTARGEEADRVAGLELGADDYITKPFSVRELVARVGAVLRRIERGGPESDDPTRPDRIEVAGLRIDRASHRATRNGVDIPLTHLEFRLLDYFARHPGRVFSRHELVNSVWGQKRHITGRSVDVYVRRLRMKMDDPDEPKLLKTVRGAGYRLETDPPPATSAGPPAP